MLQIHNFKLIVTSTANPSSIFFPFKFSFSSPFLWKSYSTQKLVSPLTVVSASFDPKRRNFTQIRRNNTFRDTEKGEKKKTTMEEKENLGFNKRRAEGRDKGKPKVLQLKTRKLNPANTICYLQILGTGMDTQDTSPSVLLFFDKQRFIFNSGEGLQRFCTEHKIKLSKIDHIFLSRVCSETAGGLPGLLLTLAGMGDEGMTVNIWGPSDIKYLIDAMKSFIPNAAMVHTHRFGTTESSMGSLFSHPNPDIANPIVLVNDEVVKISAILLRPFSVKSKYTEKGTAVGNMITESLEENGGTFSQTSSLICSPENVSVVYICELPEIKGKFDPAKAMALGLKAGPKYRELQLGKSVMSDKQNIMIHPTEVLGPSIPGPIVILVDCPTPSHLHQLMSIPSLNNFYADSLDENQDNVKKVHCVIHIGPASVTSTFDYRNWMTRFGQTQHIMAGHERKNIEVPILKSSARIASRLNFLCPQIFPASGFWSVPENIPLNTIISTEKSTSVTYDIVLAQNLLKFHLRPYAQLGLDKTGIPSLLTPRGIVNELLSEIPEIEDVSTRMKQLWDSSGRTKPMLSQCDKLIMVEEPWMDSNKHTDVSFKGNGTPIIMSDTDLPSCLEDITRENMEIVLLGTGSSQPSKYRNVSSIYLNLFSKGGIILDCGEGTLGQLKRRFGVNGADEVVKHLRLIWISHIHADHHTGLARILSLRRELLHDVAHDPLLVIGPRQLKRFLDAYSRLEDLDMQFLDCKHTTKNSLEAFKDIFESNSNQELSHDFVNNQRAVSLNAEHTLFAGGSKMESCWRKPGIVDPVDYKMLNKFNTLLNETGMDSLISVPVVHCPQAYGIVLKASERQSGLGKKIPGWKLVYSGDTRPCKSLIDASHGATVLIHEATFEDSLLDEAIAKNHSTTKEAVEVGDSSGAYRTILTHFSQRYPKIPVFDETHMHNTCIGFDLMSINIADLPILPKVNPYLKLLFKDEMARDESEDQPTLEAEI